MSLHMKKTFDDSPRGGYGLSFTIPSSYWYLRWFDVPAMLKAGASWANLMSYDLHGIWDKDNEIGSIVQAHTNLTEIKQSVDLLWRNKVSPGQVVLGTGFYGRSFRLKVPSCDRPWCAFSGDAKKGRCTNEAGILGYFEIQDILKKDKSIKKVYDKEAAVNYFKFDKDQWVSYDDKKTFDQKVEWADSIGLGGLMIWAIDLDDDDFTALSGLTGTKVSKETNKIPKLGSREKGTWSSENGGSCWVTSCNARCPPDARKLEVLTSNCKTGKKAFCCPRFSGPRHCKWRGGGFCHGQCENGELTVLYDGYGSKKCMTGQQVLCCTANRYNQLIDGCELGDCGGPCPSGLYEVAQQTSKAACGKKGGGMKPMCCKKKLESCHWVGQGQCNQSNCKNTDVQIGVSTKGDNDDECSWSRKKSLCCNPPNDIDPNTPVPLENLFPELPPPGSDVKFDAQVLAGFGGSGAESTPDNPNQDPSFGAFGFVLIAGPKEEVSSFSKRDGSHIQVVDCASITSSGRQTTRIFCSHDGHDSNCDDVLQGGLEGTIVRMPDNCGPGSYVVVHSLKRSEDQALPGHLVKRMPASKEVMDLDFSYDFSLAKRQSDDVFIRIDYSNMPGYWDRIVEDPGVRSKRSLHHGEVSQRDILDKRFFSDDTYNWKKKFDSIRKNRYYTQLKSTKKSVILSETLDKTLRDNLQCKEDANGYLDMRATSSFDVKTKFGITLIGKLKPFKIEQAYGFVDLQYEVDSTIEVMGNLGIDTTYVAHDPVIDKDQMKMHFSHPGLVSFAPSFDVRVGLEGKDAHFTGNFTAKMHTRSSTETKVREDQGFIRQTFPGSAGPNDGANLAEVRQNDFDGFLETTKGSVELSLIPDFSMGIEIQMGSGNSRRDTQDLSTRGFWASRYDLDMYSAMHLDWDRSGLRVDHGALQVSFDNTGGETIQTWGKSTKGDKSVGKAPGNHVIHETNDKDRDKEPSRQPGKSKGRTEFGDGVLKCPVSADDKLPGPCDCQVSDLCADGVVECPTDEEVQSHKGKDESSNEASDESSDKTDSEGTRDENKRRRHLHRHLRSGSSRRPVSPVELPGFSPLPDSVLQSFTKRDPDRLIGKPRDFDTVCWDKSKQDTEDITYWSIGYPSVGDWTVDDPRYDKAYNAVNRKDCTSGGVSHHVIPMVAGSDSAKYVTEHIMELQTFVRFLDDIAKHKLPDGSNPSSPRVYCDFVKAMLGEDMIKGAPPPIGSTSKQERPIVRIMEAHGSKNNWKDFVFLEDGINGVKARLWKYYQPVAEDKRVKYTHSDTEWGKALTAIRAVINVFNYMNHRDVRESWVNTANNIRAELALADKAWMNRDDEPSSKAPKRPSTHIAEYWDEWITAHFRKMTSMGKDFIEVSFKELDDHWGGRPSTELVKCVRMKIRSLKGQVGGVHINTRGLD